MKLFPIIYEEISVTEGGNEILDALRIITEKKKVFRFLFSKRKTFEGDLFQDRFHIRYTGTFARPYQVEVKGKLREAETNHILTLKCNVAPFGKALTYFWITGLTLITLFTIYMSISFNQLIVLTFTTFCLLLLVMGIGFAYYGYRLEASKSIKIIQNLVSNKITSK